MATKSPRKLVVPDLISPSYFPAIAAVELGCIERRGVDIEVELRFPVTADVVSLRQGDFDFLAGAAHALFHEAPDGGGVKLLSALSHGMYWFLVVRADLGLQRGADLSSLAGLRIGAAPGPDLGLLQMLAEVGVDSVDVGPVPGTASSGISFGVTAVEALEAGRIDGFWANGMGAELAVRKGAGTVILDARRGGGPAGSQGYTFAGLLCTQAMLDTNFDVVSSVVAGVMDAQRMLRDDPHLATGIATKLFPPMEASLTAELIARDAPFYSPEISEDEIASLVAFARQRSLTAAPFTRDDLVPANVQALWSTSA